ncbi:hypothetical protein FUAX_38360 (plasmid) [Fulvitalea axinellae]|uniref:DUF4440 domain-containing protein n=1 Tax=Fulvitalea axinellae TaxID=1182444 RepID=A0AAU9D9Y6_9BACT|nr:hypothetical protein FUAX_38360 [Fulvitalea axinellae]
METIDKTQIIELEGRLAEAMIKSDINTLDYLLHDDLLFVIPTGQTVTKEMDLSNFRSGNLNIKNITSNNQQVRLIKNCAIVSVEIDLEGSFLEEEIKGKFKYIRIWKSFDDTWKVIGGAGVSLEGKE